MGVPPRMRSLRTSRTTATSLRCTMPFTTPACIRSARDARVGRWPHGSRLEFGGIRGTIGAESGEGCGVSKPSKWGLIGAGVGFCVGLLVVGFAYYANSHFPQRDFSIPIFILAPMSVLAPPVSAILTMTTPSVQRVLVLIFAVSNALFYGVAFLVIGKISFRGRAA
jgi:hypothetical protein